MWLEVREIEDCIAGQGIRTRDVAVGRRDRGQYDGRNVSGARMWLEVEETDDCMVEAMCKEPGCGWR